MQYSDYILFYDNARLSFQKMGSNFLFHTVFTALAIYLLILVQHFIDVHFLMLALVNIYFVYTFLL